MSLLRSALLKASESEWLARNLPRYRFSRRAVRKFMPGEGLEDALEECARLAALGVATVITRLGENVTAIGEAEAAREHYLTAIADIGRGALPTHVSVKLTQLGLDIEPSRALELLTDVSRASAGIGAPVWIDMEGSKYTDLTIDLYRQARKEYENVGLCVQAYLHRTRADLAALLESTTAIRLVKGAYQEPGRIALQRKAEVDANYFTCANLLLKAARTRAVGYVPAFATHDVALIRRIIFRANELGLDTDQYEFQMLYGIRTAEQQRLASEGYRLRVLISYGSAWFAWYMRRLAERPANVWFVLRSVLTPA